MADKPLSPTEVVTKYRHIYKESYALETLHNMGQTLRFPAFDKKTKDFDKCYIVVNLKGPQHQDIWSSNFVRFNSDGIKEGIIQVNPELCSLSKARQRAILAEEWIEVMMDFSVDHPDQNDRRVLGKIEAAVLFNNLGRRALWQDSEDFTIKLHSALRYLLVSNQSIKEMIEKDFGKSIEQLRDTVETDPNLAMKLILGLIKSFSGKWPTDRELVYDRLQEILFS